MLQWGYNVDYPNITFSKSFFRDTRPDYYIFDCSYIGHSCKNTRKNGRPDKVYWKHVLSMAGNCIEFDPNTVRKGEFLLLSIFSGLSLAEAYQSHHANETEAVSSYGYHRSLSILIGYNKSDFSSGWESTLEGLVLYYSHQTEDILDPKQSLLLG